jgi:hypothetical protein
VLERILTERGVGEVTALGGGDQGADLRVDLGGGPPLYVDVRAAGRVHDAARWLAAATEPSVGAGRRATVVVAGRLDPRAREQLREAGLGYLDLARRHLVLRAPGILVDADVDLGDADLSRPAGMRSPFSPVGMAVAYHALRRPRRPIRVRQTAAELDVSPAQVSGVCKALQADDLLDEDRGIVDPSDLFWALADVWANGRTEREVGEERAVLAGAVVCGDLAAAHWGAPVVTRSERPLAYLDEDRYAPEPSPGEATFRVVGPPTAEAAAVADEGRPPFAGALAAALELAQDRGRGREILHEWDPPPRAGQERVW